LFRKETLQSGVVTEMNSAKRFWNCVLSFAGKGWLRFLFLAVIGFLARSPGLTAGFLWDDAYLAQGNPFIKSPLLALEAFRHYLFLDSFSAHYRPVQNISFMVDYYLWHTDPAGFHLTNILLHVASGLLLYRLLKHLFQNSGGLWKNMTDRVPSAPGLAAFFVAALWIVHPVHSAAIDYVSGRADSLAFLFASGAWLLVIRARAARSHCLKVALFALAALSGFLALCSREIACIWVIIFIIHSLIFARQLSRKSRIATVACCIVIFFAYGGVRSLAHGRPMPRIEAWSAPVRATLMFRALGDYGRLLVLPANLHMERTVFNPENFRSHDGWRDSIGSEYLTILGWLVAGGIVFGCMKRGNEQRMRVFGASWFVAAYLPVSNLVQLNATVAEHWLYLPSVGLLIFLAGCALEIPRRFHRLSAAIALVAILALSARSWVRSTDWQDDGTFFQRTLAARGISTRVVVNLALAYSRRGDFAQAEKALRRVLEVAPDYSIARNNLADVLIRQGKMAEAETVLVRLTDDAAIARKDYPRTWIAALNLAHLRLHDHDEADAIAILERARSDYPEVWELISLESELLRRAEGPPAALRLVEDFVRKNWWHQKASLAAAKLYAENNDTPRAVQALRHAARLDVHDVESLNLMARIYTRQNRFQQACSAQRRAVARQPYQPSQYLLLSDILEKMGRGAEAQSILAKVTRLQALAMSQPAAAR
jgi:Flp pilus assembly protein TadD